MHKSSLLEILRTFTRQELIKFEDFVRSPYFNKKENVTKLFFEIKKYAPDYSNENLGKDLIWGKVFPGKEYNYGIFKNLNFELSKIIEGFLKIQNFEAKKFEQEINYMEELKNRNLYALYQKKIKIFKEEIENSAFSLDYYYYKFYAESKEQNLHFFYGSKTDANYCNSKNMNEYFIAFFLINYFARNYNFIHESRFYDKPRINESVESVMKFFENSSFVNNIYVRIYYLVLKLILDINDEKTYYILKELLGEHFSKFCHEEICNFHMSLVNFCNFKMMNGETGYIKELFEVYKFMIAKGYYKYESENFINPSMFANIVSIASSLKQFDWAENFLNDFKVRLQSEGKEFYIAIANANLNMKKGNYESALDYLLSCKSINPIEKITIKRFQIMIYYESGFYEELYSLIDSSKHFIRNDINVTDSAKKLFGNFLKIVNKLMVIKAGNSKSNDLEFTLKTMKKDLLNTEVTNKIWLLEKLDQLKI